MARCSARAPPLQYVEQPEPDGLLYRVIALKLDVGAGGEDHSTTRRRGAAAQVEDPLVVQ